MNVLQKYVSSLNKKERREFEAAKERGYLLDRSRSRDNLQMAYMCWCETTRTPYIYVRRGEVGFWFLGGSAGLSQHGRMKLLALFRKYCPIDGDGFLEAIGNGGSAYAVMPEERELLAREVFLKIREPGVLDTTDKDICPPLPFEQSPVSWLGDQQRPRRWS